MWLLYLSTLFFGVQPSSPTDAACNSRRTKPTVQPLSASAACEVTQCTETSVCETSRLVQQITCHANEKITQCEAGGQHYVSLWNNTQHLFAALADSAFEQTSPKTKERSV